jgi:hypothetical protein
MGFFFYIFIFIIAVLIFLNVQEQYKKGNELEIYEMDYENHYGLQKICKKKQPVLFQLSPTILDASHAFNRMTLEGLAKKYGKEKVGISNTQDTSTVLHPISLRFEKAVELIHTDNEIPYLSCNNAEFMQETAIHRYAESLDEYIQPSFTLFKERDFIFGSQGATTPLGYYDNHSAFLYVASGQVTIKITPFRNERYIAKPYRKLQGRKVSMKTDLWTNHKKMEEIPSLEFQVATGWMLYIPPYWWYTIRIDTLPNSDPEKPIIDTIVVTYQYKTLMNMAIKIPESIQEQILPNMMKTLSSILPVTNSKTVTEEYEEKAPIIQTVDVEQAFVQEQPIVNQTEETNG